jgi:hypothetical protein
LSTTRAHDCRNGRVLFYDYNSHRRPSTTGFVVWDPINGGDLHRFDPGLGETWTQQAVLCAAGVSCDHRGCAGGPFIVAAVAMGFGEDDEYYNKGGNPGRRRLTSTRPKPVGGACTSTPTSGHHST